MATQMVISCTCIGVRHGGTPCPMSILALNDQITICISCGIDCPENGWEVVLH